jgi:imidazolonepropionase
MAPVAADFLISNATLVLTCAGTAPRCGARQADVAPIANGAVASRRGTIVFVGTQHEAKARLELAPDAHVVDASGRTVVPGFVDAHTHVVFAGDRRSELNERLAGASYASIAARGGGILSTVAATRAASEDELVHESLPRLAEMLRCGTTTAEAKSGYALETAGELRMLRALRRLSRAQPIELVPTFMGAHEVPPEYRDRRRGYVDIITHETIPAVAAEDLAEWCDVFCERDVYPPAESIEILRAGLAAGLKPRIHADELGPSGGSLVAAAVGARSADHLIFVDGQGIRALAGAGVVATLLPSAAFYLKLGRYAPARALITAGVPVALGSDVNPGAGFSPSLPFAMALACFEMGMTLEEAIVAATINAAYAVDRHDRAGSLEVGKDMDALILRNEPIDLVRVGTEAIDAVVKKGTVVAHYGGPMPRAAACRAGDDSKEGARGGAL